MRTMYYTCTPSPWGHLHWPPPAGRSPQAHMRFSRFGRRVQSAVDHQHSICQSDRGSDRQRWFVLTSHQILELGLGYKKNIHWSDGDSLPWRWFSNGQSRPEFITGNSYKTRLLLGKHQGHLSDVSSSVFKKIIFSITLLSMTLLMQLKGSWLSVKWKRWMILTIGIEFFLHAKEFKYLNVLPEVIFWMERRNGKYAGQWLLWDHW